MKFVKIVIPCRNEVNYIERCLMSIVNCNYDKKYLSVEVVDGLSDDGTIDRIKAITQKHDFIRYSVNEKKATPRALNLGLKPLDYDIGIILGAHAEIDPEYINECCKVFDEHPEVGCVGGIITNVKVNFTSDIISIAMSSSFGVGNAHFRTGTKTGFVDTVAFGAYRKEVFEKIGFFDEDLVRNQDDEFNFRLLKNGFKIYLSDKIKSNYYVRGSFKKLFRQYYQYGYWKVFVNKKHKTITTLRQLAPPFFVMGILTGWPLLFLNYPYNLCYPVGIACYLFLALMFAVISARPFYYFIWVFYCFIILHLSYGSGYLKGIFDFYVLNKKPAKRAEALTR